MAKSQIGINNQQAFFALLQAGLWEKEVRLLPFEDVDFEALLQVAEEQSVVGLVAAGIEHVTDYKPAKKDVLQFIGRAMQLEQQNQAMNYFIGVIVDKMRQEGITAILVKGQGVAQCYERPLWRSCGDVDFLLSSENFDKAFSFLTPLAQSVDREESYSRHIGMTIDPWVVELHGSLRCGLSKRMDKVIDEIQSNCFVGGNIRCWRDGETDVFLPGVDNDVLFIFSHFLKHFYKGGIGLRQICDWCRMIWTYRSEIDEKLLESRLQRMGLMTEWKAFGAFAVDYLGMPVEAMPLYSADAKWKRKAASICSFVLEVGNFGHNRDTSYYSKYPFFIRKAISMGWRIGDLVRHARIFPLDSLRFFPKIIFDGVRSAVKGE